MQNRKREALHLIASTLMANRHQNTYDQAKYILEDLQEAGLVEFAPCACGTFAFHTTHHWNGCTPDDIIG